MRSKLWAVLAAVLLAGCDNVGVLDPVGDELRSGVYVYDAYSNRGRLMYSGYLELRVDAGGRISGYYELPDQCTDRFGYRVDCEGHVYGRAYRDGEFELEFDDGWLVNRGVVDRYDEAAGRWEARYDGIREAGSFEMYPD